MNVFDTTPHAGTGHVVNRRHAKQLALLVLVLAMTLTWGTLRAEAAEMPRRGTCGDDLTWVLSTDGILTISGTGEMYDYDLGVRSPWYDNETVRQVVIGAGVTSIGSEAFVSCRNLTEISLPEGLNAIGSHTFQRCGSLTAVELPEGFTTLGDSAFSGCHGLTRVELPDTLTTIGEAAFYDCDALETIALPVGLEMIGNYAFLNCSSLRQITVSADNPYYACDEFGVLYNQDRTELVAAPGAIQTYRVPGSVARIGDTAFTGCRSLTEITFSEGLTAIGDYAFQHCSGLTAVELPDGLTAVGDVAFEFCTGLTGVSFPDGLASIGDYAFQCCDSLTDITFRGSAAGISPCAFEGITATAHYPLACISWNADLRRDYGGKLTWVPYGQAAQIASGWTGLCRWSLTSDGVLTVSGSGNMKNYDYERNQPWKDYVNLIDTAVIEEGVTGVGSGAFMGMTDLRTVTLPRTGLTRIGEAAFYGCTGLEEIFIPDSIYTVADYTFKNCTALADVRLSGELVKIGQGAFENCTALTYLFVPGQTGIIGAWSFKGCTALEEVDMQWADATGIREGAFKNCASLTRIALPGDIQVLGESCFYGIGAASFTVPETVREIGGWCFARAYGLETVTFRGDAPAIGEGAFNKLTLTAKYPAGNPTWTEAGMASYGGSITWEAY